MISSVETLSPASPDTTRAIDGTARLSGRLVAALRPLALIGLTAGAITTRADPDLWGHLRFGLDTLAAGSVATADRYSFTTDRPWINHEWLSEAITAAVYRTGGVAGLMAFKALLAVSIFALIWQALRGVHSTWRWTGLAIAAWGMLPLVSTLRPQLWTGLLIVALCRVLASSSSRAPWWLPPIFAIWANLHGGWIVGGGLVAVWTAAAWVERSPRRWTLLAAGTASLAATMVNPYGWHLLEFLAHTVRFGRDHITEWQPVWDGGTPMVWLWALPAALIALTWWRVGRPSLVTLCALAALATAGARVGRLEPLFALAAVVLLSRQWPRAEATASPARRDARIVLDACAVAIIVGVALRVQIVPHCITTAGTPAPDTVAGESLRPVRGRLVTSFNWGEYAIWHFGPALQVSIDGRRETLYSERTVAEQLGIMFGEPIGIAALARMAPDYVWLPNTSDVADGWLRQHGYRVDVRTAQSFVAVRNDLPPLATWHGTATGCFPGP